MYDELTEFYQKEYDTLSQAHFQAAERITTFFQYALVILAAPLTIFELTNNVSQVVVGRPFICIICIAISLVGFFIVLYLGQLRTEVLMYARCINTIRKFFYEYALIGKPESSITNFYNEYSVLLIQKRKPKFWDGEQFILIILSLGTINTLYLGYAIYNLVSSPKIIFIIVICLMFMSLHIISYYLFTRISESNTRFYKHIIGIDIDGVLNMHKEQFVKIYNELIDKEEIKSRKICLDDIKTIPVQDAGLIKKENADKVFKTVEYWSDMLLMDGADKVINETLKNKFGYRIHIFTSRDWNLKDQKGKTYDLKKYTKIWLKNVGIKQHRIFFEKGNFDRPISSKTALYKNRFYISAKRKIEFFIEDEPIKARKLANICKFVFLIDHPYNKEVDPSKPFPINVIRLKGWSDIETKIKDLI